MRSTRPGLEIARPTFTVLSLVSMVVFFAVAIKELTAHPYRRDDVLGYMTSGLLSLILYLALTLRRTLSSYDKRPYPTSFFSPAKSRFYSPEEIDDAHARLEALGYTPAEIINHKVFGFFFDPYNRQITGKPVITNTGHLLDESTARELAQNKMGLFANQPVKAYVPAPSLRKLLQEYIAHKENKLRR